MRNKAALKQVRKGYSQLINESPMNITVSRKPTTIGQSGQVIEDPYGTPVEKIVKVRVAHRRQVIAENETTPIGIATDLVKYLLWEHDKDIRENDTFAELKGYRVGKPDELTKFGGVYGYQAQLIEATS